MDLGSHVRRSSELGLKHAVSCLTFGRCGKAEISDLQVEVAVEHKILWLKIAMHETGAMQVVESFDQLLEVESGVLLLKFAAESNEVEELTAANKLQHDVLDSLAHVLLGV